MSDPRFSLQQLERASQIVKAFYRKGYTRKEIGAILGISENHATYIKNKSMYLGDNGEYYAASSKSVFDVLRWWDRTNGIIQ